MQQKPEQHSRLDRRTLTKTGVAATAGVAFGHPAMQAVAQENATPVDNVDVVTTPEVVESTPVAEGTGGMPLPEGATLVADGFSNPRFIAVGSDGTLYVTEVGVGGDEPFGEEGASGEGEVATPGATPVAEAAPTDFTQTRGYTGVVSRVTTDGTREVLLEGLPSYGGGVGLAGIALGPGEVYFAVGGVAVGVGASPLPEENTIWRYAVDTGELTQVASLGQYEVENNPDGTDVNPNLYEITNTGAGTLFVADAGGNTVYRVDLETGEFDLIGVTPDYTELTGETLDPELGSGQFVPTGLDLDANGALYVSALAELWPEGSPTIGTMDADGVFAPIQTSETLNWVVGLDVGPDGNLYASQMTGGFTEEGPAPGRVVRITLADGTVEPVVENVMLPHGLTFDNDGNMFLVIYSAFVSAPGAPAGMVVRVDGVAPPA